MARLIQFPVIFPSASSGANAEPAGHEAVLSISKLRQHSSHRQSSGRRASKHSIERVDSLRADEIAERRETTPLNTDHYERTAERARRRAKARSLILRAADLIEGEGACEQRLSWILVDCADLLSQEGVKAPDLNTDDELRESPVA